MYHYIYVVMACLLFRQYDCRLSINQHECYKSNHRDYLQDYPNSYSTFLNDLSLSVCLSGDTTHMQLVEDIKTEFNDILLALGLRIRHSKKYYKTPEQFYTRDLNDQLQQFFNPYLGYDALNFLEEDQFAKRRVHPQNIVNSLSVSSIPSNTTRTTPRTTSTTPTTSTTTITTPTTNTTTTNTTPTTNTTTSTTPTTNTTATRTTAAATTTPISTSTTVAPTSTSPRLPNSTCIKDTSVLITQMLSGQPWAFQFFDATGKPGPSLSKLRLNFVGNYDQCRQSHTPVDKSSSSESNFGGNYCVITLTSYLPLNLGVCLPDTCLESEINQLMEEVFLGKRIVNQLPIYKVSTSCLTAPTEMTSATIIAIIILSIISAFIFFGTMLDIIILVEKSMTPPELLADSGNTITESEKNDQNGDNRAEISSESLAASITDSFEGDNDRRPLVGSSSSYVNMPSQTSRASVNSSNRDRMNCSAMSSSNVVLKVFLAFSLYTNGKKLLNTSQTPGSISSIHGIRFFSMSWVVLGHWYAFGDRIGINQVSALPELVNRWTFMPIANGFFSVDSFFTMSGILCAYGALQEMNRRQTFKIRWGLFYFHRFWRLTPPYMFALVIILGLQQYMGHGPLWPNMEPADKENCEKYWWTNLLYINNFFDQSKQCFGVSWYLANDMQFFIISPLFLIPLFINKIAGIVVCGVFILACCIVSGVLSHIENLPTTLISLHPDPNKDVLNWFDDYYIKPYCRIGPFIVGIMAGYLLVQIKQRQYKLQCWAVVLGWLIAIATGLGVVYGIRGDVTGDNISSIESAALYNSVSHTLWGACVSWVVIACTMGYGGPINTFLSWSPFVMLGRLTYMTYLIHISMLFVYVLNYGSLLWLNDMTNVVNFLGLYFAVNMAAFVATLVLESPMLALEKIFISRD